jgi:hypothetical protein
MLDPAEFLMVRRQLIASGIERNGWRGRHLQTLRT